MDYTFLSPLSDDFDHEWEEGSLGAQTLKHTGRSQPELQEQAIVIVGVCEHRGGKGNTGVAKASDTIRKELYKLSSHFPDLKILDVGNIIAGETLQDTYSALAAVAFDVHKEQSCILILGGTQDLTYPQYCAFEKLEQTVNIVSVDPRFDLGTAHQSVTSTTYLGKIVLHQPNFLFNYSNVGYQSYYVNQETVDLMERMLFDVYRLGQVRNDIEQIEPIVRNADIVTFDVGAIRASDAPGCADANPHGFHGEEACKIARYAGFSDKLSSFGLYEFDPDFDPQGITTKLLGQLLWYFMDGFYSRRKDFPLTSKTGFNKYRVTVDNTSHEIIFHKSSLTDRWWMEVPYTSQWIKYQRHHIIPCSEQDYKKATRGEFPERWWKAFQKLSAD